MTDDTNYRTFDSFEPGALIGETEVQMGEALRANWAGIGQQPADGKSALTAEVTLP